jgi:phytanoyl-CoA hydroxylase
MPDGMEKPAMSSSHSLFEASKDKEAFRGKIDRAAVLAAYERDGYYVFRNAIDSALVSEMRDHTAWLIRKYPDLRPEHFHHPLLRDDAFWVSVVTNPVVLDFVEMFMGRDIACFTAHYIYKPARDGHAVLWHQDLAYWKLDTGRAITCWISLFDSKPDNGCLYMLPGSHRLGLQPITLETKVANMLGSKIDLANLSDAERELCDVGRAVAVELEPGDMSVHHPLLVHGSQANTSDRPRCGLDIGYMDTSTTISNTDLYLDPLLCRGDIGSSKNRYRAWPMYNEDDTVPFRGHETWNQRAAAANRPEFRFHGPDDPAPYEIVKRMMLRLMQGSARH